ncbi:unnamed protein product, partial [Symbiodinium microadriaticum]
MANSKGRFQTFKHSLDWDFSIAISAIQGHSRLPEQVSDIAQGERLTQQRAIELGFIFHASENHNYESIKGDGLLLRATRRGWQRHRMAIHFVYAGGSASPGPGTVVRFGSNIFYAQLDIGTFSNHAHELFLTDNGVVLCYQDVAPMCLTFHYRPPHEKDPGGLKHEEKQRAAGVSSSFEEATPSAAASSSDAARGSPSGEVPAGARAVRHKDMPKKKAKAKGSTDAESSPTGGSPSGEVPVPVVDEASLPRLIPAALVKATPFSSLPIDMRKLLGSEYSWATWLSHPLSGYGIHFFLKGFELGKMQGNTLVELNWKGKAYILRAINLVSTRGLATMFPLSWRSSAMPSTVSSRRPDVGFRIIEETDPRNKKPKKDDPDYAAKLMLYNAFCFERDVWAEVKAVRADFSTVVSAVSQAYGPDFFSYMQKHCDNLERAREIDELYTRPVDDIVVEEFISNLPGPTIEEVDEPMNQAGSPADAPADSPSGEMAGAAKQEPTSSAPMETDAPEASPSGEESGVKVEKAERTSFDEAVAAPDDVRVDDAGEDGDHDVKDGSGSFKGQDESLIALAMMELFKMS